MPKLTRVSILSWAGSTALLIAHAVTLSFLPSHTAETSDFFAILAASFALITCLRQYLTASAETRLQWLFFSIAICLWTCGMILSAWEDFVLRSDSMLASYADLVYFLYGIPIILAISFPTTARRTRIFFVLDAIQVTAVAGLSYLSFFAAVPLLSATLRPVSANVIAVFYAVENIALASAATLRYWAATTRETKNFFRILTIFLWSYAACATIYNATFLGTKGGGAYFSLFAEIAFVVLSALNLTDRRCQTRDQANGDSLSVQILSQGSPIFFTLALSLLGLITVRHHPYIGAVAILFAAMAYAVRMTVLQVFYVRAQQSLELAQEELTKLSLTDALTGLANRRSFDESLQREWKRANREGSSLSLMMIDIDFFKRLNDRYGHQQGDDCLKTVAAALRDNATRATDIVARFGGEEFAIVLPGTDSQGAIEVAEHIRRSVTGLMIPNIEAETKYVTLSIGLAVTDLEPTDTAEEFLRTADIALYRAKQNGRNRVELGLSPRHIVH